VRAEVNEDYKVTLQGREQEVAWETRTLALARLPIPR